MIGVIGADLVAIGVSAATTAFRGPDLELAAILLACNLATVELTRRAGEPAGLAKDVHAVWELPMALLLPPVYGLLVPIPRDDPGPGPGAPDSHPPARLHRGGAGPVLRRGLGGVPRHGARCVLGGDQPAGPGAGLGRRGRRVRRAQVGGEQGPGHDRGKGTDPAASVRRELFTREPLFNDAPSCRSGSWSPTRSPAARSWRWSRCPW